MILIQCYYLVSLKFFELMEFFDYVKKMYYSMIFIRCYFKSLKCQLLLIEFANYYNLNFQYFILHWVCSPKPERRIVTLPQSQIFPEKTENCCAKYTLDQTEYYHCVIQTHLSERLFLFLFLFCMYLFLVHKLIFQIIS